MKIRNPRASVQSLLCILVSCLLVLAHDSAVAQEDTELEIVFKAEVGQQFSVRVERTREVTKKGAVERTHTVTTYAGNVERELEAGWLVSWKVTDIRIISPDGSQSSNMSEPYADTPLLFETNEFGHPVKLVNMDAWWDLTGKLVKSDISILKRTLTPETLEQMYLVETLLIAKFQGAILPLNQTLHEDTELPSPVGEGTIQAETMTSVTSLDREKGIATAQFVLRFKPHAAKEAGLSFLRKIAKDQGKPEAEVEAELSKDKFDLLREDTVETVIDLATGWPIETNARREVRTGDGDRSSGKLDIWKINVQQIAP